MTNERVQEIDAKLKAVYDLDCKEDPEAKTDLCGISYDAPRYSAAVETLKASGEWESYKAARPDVFATA